MIDLNSRAAEVHAANAKWWHDINTGERLVRNRPEMKMLIVSELAEALEGERKNKMDDHLPHRRMPEVEIADTYIRALDYAAGHGIAIDYWIVFKVSLVAKVPENRGEALFGLSTVVDCIDSTEGISIFIGGLYAYCFAFGYDLEGAYHEKMAYNATRADHSREERLKANGKKF